MSANWESILDQLLCGLGSRADAESLRLQLSLSIEERDEIESTLRLVDELIAAGETSLAPQGAPQRMVQRLRDRITRNPAPAKLPTWQRSGSGYQADPLVLGAPDAAADEETALAIIEGTSPAESVQPRPSSGPTDEGGRLLEEFKQVADALSAASAQPPIPSGAEDRLVARFRQNLESEDGALDPAVPRRILRQLQAVPGQDASNDRRPDVLAATKESEGESESAEPRAPGDDETP